MDLSSLLSQTEMSYSKINFYKSNKNIKKQKNQQHFISVFQQNFDLLSSFISFRDTQSLRLVCRGVGYLFIVKDLWGGIKSDVADKKLQDFDDYQFVQEQPKQISKQDKKIRIHSLKKNMINNSLNKKVKRQPSNIKQKKMTMSVIDNELNPFQKTQIGFKRLLKTTNPSLIKPITKQKQYKNSDIEQTFSLERLPQLLQIPSQYSIDDLIINPKDQWVKNMHRANNLISVVRRWNTFYNRLWNVIERDQIQLIHIMKKVIKIDGCLLSYKTTMEEQPQCTIVKIISESAPKNALIEQQLNKLGKQFALNHQKLKQLIEKRQSQHLITALHQCYQKISQKLNKNKIQASLWAEGLSILDQSYDNIVSKITDQKLKTSLIKSINNIFKQLIDNHLAKEIIFSNENQNMNFKSISLKFLIQNSEFCQLSFQILYNLIGKLSNGNNAENILVSSSSLKQNQYISSSFTKKLKPMQKQVKMISSTLNKLKYQPDSQKVNRSQKTLFGVLWNISKYFDKLQKQLSAKQKKRKQEQKVMLIKQFLQNQSTFFKDQILLIFSQSNQSSYFKTLMAIQEYYKEFKIKIDKLKDDMAKALN